MSAIIMKSKAIECDSNGNTSTNRETIRTRIAKQKTTRVEISERDTSTQMVNNKKHRKKEFRAKR